MKACVRFRRRLTALCAVLLLLLLAVPSAHAQEGDLDRINQYTVTVDPRVDGSADITYDIDWEVIGGSSEDPLSWVKIGLPNDQANDFENLTPDTVSSVRLQKEGSNIFARVTFVRRYYEPVYAAQAGQQSRVQFAFKVRQSYLYTRNSDGTASYVFTPGWFDDLEVQNLTIRWKAADGMTADTDTLEDGYYVWDFGTLDHGEKATVRVQMPAAAVAAYDPATEMPASAQSDPMGAVLAVLLFSGVLGLIVYLLYRQSARPHWRGGFSDGEVLWYTNGVHTIHLAPGAVPPSGYRPTNPPAGFHADGGSFRGGGAGRTGGSCACACVASCACACACAGGGRAGCSVKNFYRIAVTTGKEDGKEESHEH